MFPSPPNETWSNLIADAASVLERTAVGHESLLAVVAEPLSSTTDFLEELSAHSRKSHPASAGDSRANRARTGNAQNCCLAVDMPVSAKRFA